MKKKAGKFLSLLLAAAMVCALALPASAAEETGNEDGVMVLYTNDVHTYIDNNVGEGNENGLTYSKVAALKAVSYTHLDVYKRQDLLHRHRRCSRGW